MIPPISESPLVSPIKPVEPPKKLADLMTYEPPILRPSGLQLRVPAISVAESVIERLSASRLLPITLDRLRDIESEEARAAEALKHYAGQEEHTVKKLLG